MEGKKSKLNKFLQCIVLIMCCIALSPVWRFMCGCAVKKGKVYEKEGKFYGKTGGIFKSQWDDYYLRGLSYSEGGYWEDAASDFLIAIKKRPKDKRRARTYGMHTINYFPNRELGISYFHLGRFKESMQALESSLKSVESARAKYYLNQARKAWLEQTNLDKRPPSITLQFPPVLYRTNEFAISVRGTAQDNYFVSNIIFNGKSSHLELSKKKVAFKEVFSLTHGKNVITLRSEDILGKISPPLTIQIEVDREGPLIFLKFVKNTEGSFTVSGAAYDTSGLSSVTIHGRKHIFDHERLAFIKETFDDDNSFPGTDIHIKAEDSIGNQTIGYLQIHCFKENNNFPKIDLNGLRDGLTSFLDTLLVQGAIYTAKGVSEIMVNGQSLLYLEESKTCKSFLKSLRTAQCGCLFFSKNMKLNNEKNNIVVSFADSSGRTAKNSFAIIKKIPVVKQIKSRMTIAVLPFEHNKTKREGLEKYVQKVLNTSFISQARFNVVSLDDIDRILKGRPVSLSYRDRAGAASLGRLLRSESVLTGEINTTENSFEIDATLVDTQSSHIIAEKDVYWESTSRSSFRENIDHLALKFKKHFPLCEGTVIHTGRRKAIINMGQNYSIKFGMKFLAFDEYNAFPSPSTEINLGKDSIILGFLSAREIMRESTVTDILEILTEREIRVGAKVITK